MTKRWLVALLLGSAVVIAIIVVAVHWPSLPERTTLTPMKVAPPVNCLSIGRSVQLADMRWTDYTHGPDDPHHASIALSPRGGQWIDNVQHQSIDLLPDELHALTIALTASCEVDTTLPRHGFEGRYIVVDDSTKVPYNSPAAVAVGAVFDAVRARYVHARLPIAKTLVLSLAGQYQTAAGWEPYTLELRPSGSDEDIVGLADWAIRQPADRPPGHLVASGTITIDGVSRRIAISLDREASENAALARIEIGELGIWMSQNRPR